MYRNIYIYIYHSNSSLLGAPATSTNQTMSILGGSILFGCAPYDSLPSSLIPYHRLSNLGISCSKATCWFLFGIPGSSNFGASNFDVLTASCDPSSSFSPWKNGKTSASRSSKSCWIGCSLIWMQRWSRVLMPSVAVLPCWPCYWAGEKRWCTG